LVCHRSTEVQTNYDTELHLTSAAAAAFPLPSPAQSPDLVLRRVQQLQQPTIIPRITPELLPQHSISISSAITMLTASSATDTLNLKHFPAPKYISPQLLLQHFHFRL
jgi:hypothetical protein